MPVLIFLQMVHHEQESRQKYEREQRDSNEKRWDALKQLNDDELKAMRDVQKVGER